MTYQQIRCGLDAKLKRFGKLSGGQKYASGIYRTRQIRCKRRQYPYCLLSSSLNHPVNKVKNSCIHDPKVHTRK